MATKPKVKPKKAKPKPAPAIAERPLRLEYRSPAELAENPANWRRHPESQLAALTDVIAEVGWAGVCLFNEATGRLLDGHARKKVAVDQGVAEVPVLIGSWTEAQERLILATFDPISAQAEADPEKLAALLAGIETESAAVEALLAGLAAADPLPVAGAGGDEFDATPEASGPTRTQVGEVWVIGGEKGHRLLVGDCTDPANVLLLMNGERAGLMNTDPPYGVSYANDERPNPGVAKPRVANDGLADEALQTFLESVFTFAVEHALEKSAAWYLWHAHLTQGYFAAAAAAAANVVLHRQIIWVKPVLLLGRGQYHWKHEPCFMGWVEGNQPPDYGLGAGERTQTTVWELNGVSQADRKEFNHATPKPVDLFTTPIIKHLKANEIAYEPFAGSGPQFIAAHRAGRRCFGMELDPRHADTILKRCEAEGLACEKAG